MTLPGRPILLTIAIEPAHARDRIAVSSALDALSADNNRDICFEHDVGTGQTIVRGHDEAGLDDAIAALRDGRGFALRVGAPQVAYRETLTTRIETNVTHKKARPGGHAFARVRMAFEPCPGAIFAAAFSDGAFPHEFIAGVARGVETARRAGVQAGFPVVDVKATLLDGAWHETDSSPAAFEMAAITAFREAQSHAGVLMEPIMRVEVTAPGCYAGTIEGDLAARRGTLQSRTAQDRVMVVATAPLANLIGYPLHLRSLTQGHGSVAVRFSHFATVAPPEPPRFPPAAAMRARRSL